jgi:hypothetical protein
MPSWTLTPTQNAIILEVTKILLSNLILYLLFSFWWFHGDYNSKVWADTYITEQILRIIPHKCNTRKRLISIISRLFYLGTIILTAFFVTIMTKTTTSSTSVQANSPVSLTVIQTLDKIIPSFSLQTLNANNMSFPLAMCRLYYFCSTEYPGIGEGVYYTPVGDNITFVPARQTLFEEDSLNASFSYPGGNIGFNWGLAHMGLHSALSSGICISGITIPSNSTVISNNNTVIMEYNVPFTSSPITNIDASITGNLGCYLSKVDMFRNQTWQTRRNDGDYDLTLLFPSSISMISGISIMSDIATVSSEIFPMGDVDRRAIRLDIVATQQSFFTYATSGIQPYSGTSKYMSAECTLLLKSLIKPNLAVRSNRTSKVNLKRQQDESVVMEACSITSAGQVDKLDWVYAIVNTSWTTTSSDKYNVSIKYGGLPGIGGVTDEGDEGALPPSNLMLFDYSTVPENTADLNSTSLARLDETIDKYLHALQTLHYNNDTVWGIRMGVFQMTAIKFSMVGATLIELPYVVTVATLGFLGLLATLFNKFLLSKPYSKSFPLNVAKAVDYNQKDRDSFNSIYTIDYSLVQLHPSISSSENSFSILLNNRLLSTESHVTSTVSAQSQHLLSGDIDCK